MRRGELYRVRRPDGDPKRSRVFVVVSRGVVIESSFSTVVCAPVYSRGHGLSTQVDVGPGHGLKHTSVIHCDALMSVPKERLTSYVGRLDGAALHELDLALAIALELDL